MGGIGSGRHFHYSTRSYTDDYLDLDIRTLNQHGWLNKTTPQTLTWKTNQQVTGSVQFLVRTRVQFPLDNPTIRLKYKSRSNGGEWEELNYSIELETTKCNFGGLRYWFKCPECSKRTCVLYGGTIFKCRSCHGLVHKSRNESALDQATRRLDKEKGKLWPNETLCFYDSVEWLDKPKWVRHRTFNQEIIKLIALENKVKSLMSGRLM
tara:strand:- start:76 stop:699 length:624 start_codon:yes stop_codon:yes gene_type:complete